MIYALWEILIPLLIAFLLGVLLGWFIWRWRRTKVTSSEWSSLQERAASAGNAAHDERVIALTADLEVRDMEIEQLRKSHADARAKIAELESVEPSAVAESDDRPSVGGERHPFGDGSHGPLSDDSQPDARG